MAAVSYWKTMLYCGRLNNHFVETALEYLPDEIYRDLEGKLAITVLASDACRLAEKVCEKEEVIVLSPWLFSFIPAGCSEANPEWRYLIFAILHEIAHAVLKHKPPDEISGEENAAQEKEADETALKWFNDNAAQHPTTRTSTLSREEIENVKGAYRRQLTAVLGDG